VVYFPAGANNTHITRLNTQTCETETIKVLSFHPRCLVAKNGFVCCGGEKGEFALIRDVKQADGGTVAAAAVADDTLSNDFRAQLSSALESPSLANNTSLTQFSRDMLNLLEQRLSGPPRAWTMTNNKFGDERVNCITIWLPPQATDPHPARPGSYPSPVALLANNDKTLVIVGLHDCDQLDKIKYPDCVNRGVITPDGTILAAITDDPYLYVHVRTLSRRSAVGEAYEWKALPRVRLKSKDKENPDDCKGSFALCYSPSGRYLAVGTQYGTISIFEVAALSDPNRDPLVTWFNSTRFPHDDGAIRDMAFCPGPYDLLAWSEHRGRVGVADGRTNFAQRQVITIGDHKGFEAVALNERNTTIDPRLLDQRTERSAQQPGSASHLSSLLATSPPRPLPQPGSTDFADRYNHPFTAEETAVLEAVQNDRRRREAVRDAARDLARDPGVFPRAAGGLRPSIWAERVSDSRSSLASLRSTLHWAEHQTDAMELETYREVAHILQRQRETLSRILEREQRRGDRDQHRATSGLSLADYERERNTRTRDASVSPRTGIYGGPQRAPTPRRRSSIMQTLSSGGNNDDSWNIESQDPPASDVAQRLTSGWADLEALYTIAGGDGNGSGDGGGAGEASANDNSRAEASRSRRALPIITDVWNDELAGFGQARRYGRGMRDHQQNGDDTGGLAWSEDGQSL
jgi:hypothetical protein